MRKNITLALLTLAVAGCGAPAFQQRRTPSGVWCADMPILPAGETPHRAFHRVAPVASALTCVTEAERLESLRREACKRGGDAVIEAANEELNVGPPQGYVTRAAGTAVVWTSGATP